jgi:hypothetical protein
MAIFIGNVVKWKTVGRVQTPPIYIPGHGQVERHSSGLEGHEKDAHLADYNEIQWRGKKRVSVGEKYFPSEGAWC